MGAGKIRICIAADEEIDHVRSRAGTTCPVTQNNETATKDAIRHFADGIGDPNPLWRDVLYSSNSRHKSLIAPPTFLNAIVPGQWSEGFSGIPRYVTG